MPYGPPPRIVGQFPTAGAGLDCDSSAPDCGVPRDAPIEFRFDRFLDPATTVRQAVAVYTRFPDLGVFLSVEYDVVERVVTFRPYGTVWEPGTLYTVFVRAPVEDGEDGFRAFDGAPVEDRADGGAAFFTFRTRDATPDPVVPPSPPTCSDVLSVLGGAGCASTECHRAPEPAAGLDLSSGAGLARTAHRRVARETETAPSVGRPLVDPARFGQSMPIIDPGRAAGSYLLYKLLAKPENYGESCSTRHAVAQEGDCFAPEADELGRLRESVVRLDPMPPEDRSVGGVDALRTIAGFIEAGASLVECE